MLAPEPQLKLLNLLVLSIRPSLLRACQGPAATHPLGEASCSEAPGCCSIFFPNKPWTEGRDGGSR